LVVAVQIMKSGNRVGSGWYASEDAARSAMFIDLGLRALKIVSTQPFLFLLVEAAQDLPLSGLGFRNHETDREGVVWVSGGSVLQLGGKRRDREPQACKERQRQLAVKVSSHVLR